jgi:hypothetical protein
MLKIFGLISILAAIAIGAYLYVSDSSNTITSGSNPPTSSSAETSAGHAVDNFSDRTQQNLQQVQSQYSQ